MGSIVHQGLRDRRQSYPVLGSVLSRHRHIRTSEKTWWVVQLRTQSVLVTLPPSPPSRAKQLATKIADLTDWDQHPDEPDEVTWKRLERCLSEDFVVRQVPA
jgi:hypothetical protein